jgi:hypothetical protein
MQEYGLLLEVSIPPAHINIVLLEEDETVEQV